MMMVRRRILAIQGSRGKQEVTSAQNSAMEVIGANSGELEVKCSALSKKDRTSWTFWLMLQATEAAIRRTVLGTNHPLTKRAERDAE